MHVEEEGLRPLPSKDAHTPASSPALVVGGERHSLAAWNPAVPALKRRVVPAGHIERDVEPDLIGVNAEGGTRPGRRDSGAPEAESIDDRIGEDRSWPGLAEYIHHDDESLWVVRGQKGVQVREVRGGICER